MSMQSPLHTACAFTFAIVLVAAAAQPAAAAPANVASVAVNSAAGTVAQAANIGLQPRGAIRAISPALSREVFGFALASSLSDPTVGYPSWNFSLLSTVAFFGLHVNWDGKILADAGWSTWNSSALTALVTKAHSNGVKVVVTIILQDFASGTPTMCAGLINRATTVSQTVAQVAAKGVDGVNIDYEGLNSTCQNGQTARSMMTDFASRLRAALPDASYLSVDTYASSAGDSAGFFDVAGLGTYVDSFFVMAYDIEYSNWRRPPISCSSFCLGPTAPLAGYYYNDINTAAQYALAVPASKVILGVPYYGRKACVSSTAPNGRPSGSVVAVSYLTASHESSSSDVKAGSFAAHRDPNDPRGLERWDTWFNTALNCTRELYWDDTVSLAAKYDLVNKDGLRGVGIWNLNYGGSAPELWAALASRFAACQSVSVSSSPPSTAPSGTKVSITASAAGCPKPLYEFWILAPGSSTWQLAQGYSTNATLAWSTAGKAPGLYKVTVWARDTVSIGVHASSLGRWDATSNSQYQLTSTPCTAVSASASPASPSSIGTAISVTAIAATCPNPLYRFLMLAPGAATWQTVQAYSSNGVFAWPTAGKRAGTYRITVWARDASSLGTSASSLGSWDVSNNSQYALTAPCAGLTVSYSRPSSAPVGTVVTLTAAAAGCVSPLYQFWMLPPGAGSWQVARAYSTTATFSWTTAGKPAGVYRITVWTRDANSDGAFGSSAGRWDASNNSQYTLTAAVPCSSVAATYAPVTTARAGTSVTITAAAAGCANPRYELWILAPGATSWQLVQAYSANAGMVWNTTGKKAGIYRITVWARDANDSGRFSNSLGRWDASANGQYTLS
jgi:spore germination protein YaaH